jgi:hypothetical protein
MTALLFFDRSRGPARLGDRAAKALLVLLLAAVTMPAHALPAFARQTGQNCVACHVSFPELTPYGRFFKLNGYTIGTRQDIPLAVMAQAGYSAIAKPTDDSGALVQAKDRQLAFSAASVFAAGKFNDNLGLFSQYTFENLNVADDGSTYMHPGIDNTELRAVARWPTADGNDTAVLAGLTLHNNPTMQDVWNSSPAWGYPYTSSPNQVSPAASSQLDGGLAQQVVGLGGYVYVDRSWYGELSFYRTADGIFSLLRDGQDKDAAGGVGRLQGYNPYVRLAWNWERGPHSLMLGGFAAQFERYPDNTIPTSGTDRFRDWALDAQYQYITSEHTVSVQASRIQETQDWRTSYPATLAGNPIGAGATPANPVDHLTTTRLRAAYQYQRSYGAGLQLFDIRGDADGGLYAPGSVNGSANGSPDSRGYLAELTWNPIQNLHVMAQYTGYWRFNGGESNYDGSGRSAGDNNTLFLNLWVAY